MGIFSRHHRYREAGEAANVNNVARFGEPVRSLFTTTKVFTLHHLITITDANEKAVYEASTKFPSIHDKTDVRDAAGQQVAHIERKIFTLHGRHFVTMADGTRFELATELFHLIRDVINIEGLGWKIEGNIAGLNFELYDAKGAIIAVISQKMFSMHDKYCIDIYQPELEPTVVTILVTLQHIIKDRQASASTASFSSSSSSH